MAFNIKSLTGGLVKDVKSPIGGSLGKLLSAVMIIVAGVGIGASVGVGTASVLRSLNVPNQVVEILASISSLATGGPIGVVSYLTVSGLSPFARFNRETGGAF